MDALSLEKISFSYGDTKVIDDFSLNVEQGTFTTLLGSSGSGKTTLLRLVSGFLEPSSGEIKINGELVNGMRPEKRHLGMVFQDYALFPHLTVLQNLLYGLKINGIPQSSDGRMAWSSKKKSMENLLAVVDESTKILEIKNLYDRYPGELSGGQQQRVALGRALVLQPKILLMDEPLSSLDANLRQSVRAELRDIQRRLKITTVYVTHDQEEALSLSDRIAVLNGGRLSQYGSPRELYFSPENRFTAEFIGSVNFIFVDGKEYMVRPEWIRIKKTDTYFEKKDKWISGPEGTIVSQEFFGNRIRHKIKISQGMIYVDTFSVEDCEIKNGDTIKTAFVNWKEM